MKKTFALSLELLQRSLGEQGERLSSALCALGHAPAAGVGASLGAALTGLSEADFLLPEANPIRGILRSNGFDLVNNIGSLLDPAATGTVVPEE